MKPPRGQSALFFWVVVLFWFSQYVYIPYFSPHLDMLGISASMIGVIMGAYGFSQLVLRIPLSMADTLTGNHNLFIGCGLLTPLLACVMPFLSTSPVVYLLARLLAGVASSTWVSFVASVLEGPGPSANQRSGRMVTANNLGILLAQVASTLLYSHTGIKPLFLVAIGTALVGFLLFLFMLWRKKRAAEAQQQANSANATPEQTTPAPMKERLAEALKNFWQVLQNGHLWLCSLLMAISQFIQQSTNSSFTGVYAKRLGANDISIGLISISFLAAGIVVSFILQRMGHRRLPERALLVISFILTGVYCVLTAFCTSPTLLILIQLVGGAGRVIQYVILMGSAGRYLKDNQKAFCMGIFQSVYCLGMTLGPVAAGAFFDLSGNYSVTFALIGAVSAAGAVWSFFSYKNPPATQEPAS